MENIKFCGERIDNSELVYGFIFFGKDGDKEIAYILNTCLEHYEFPGICVSEGYAVHPETVIMCSNMNPLNEVLTLGEATLIWGLADSTLRWAIRRGRFKEDEYRKAETVKGEYLILKSAMIRLYGEVK
ncbi:MAG: helix-turn-helix domain-containing protein [Thermincolia bacterium]